MGSIEKIFTWILVIILEEIIRRFSTYVFIKYQLKERKILLLISVLLFLGLLFSILGFVFLLMEQQDGTLSITSAFCYGSIGLIGVALLILLGVIIVRKDDIYPVDPNKLDEEPRYIKTIKQVRYNTGNKRQLWGWIFSIVGFLIVAGCIYLFVRYGPINEPYISPEHEANDRFINYCCGSSAFIGIVLFAVGVWTLTHSEKPPM